MTNLIHDIYMFNLPSVEASQSVRVLQRISISPDSNVPGFFVSGEKLNKGPLA